MMNAKRIGATLGLTMYCGMAWAAGASEAAPAPTEISADETKAKGNPGRRVCRTVEPTGTRFVKRICRTQQEWDESTERARRNHEERQRDGSDVPHNAPN